MHATYTVVNSGVLVQFTEELSAQEIYLFIFLFTKFANQCFPPYSVVFYVIFVLAAFDMTGHRFKGVEYNGIF